MDELNVLQKQGMPLLTEAFTENKSFIQSLRN